MRRWWPLVLVLAVQFGILAAIPARKVAARLLGTDVTLWTRPVDPYDALSGYHVTLGYEVERPDPERVEDGIEDGDEVYVNLVRDVPAWRVRSVSRDLPGDDGDGVSIRATWRSGNPALQGVDRLFIPEARRQRVADAMREAEGRALADLEVDGNGNAAVLRLRVGGEVFGD